MQHFLDTLLSSIAPHECVACDTTGKLLCANCLDLLPEVLSKCYRCSKATKNFQTCAPCRKVSPLAAVWVCTDYETVARQLVQKLKFERAYASADAIAQAIAANVGKQLPYNALLSPIPTATSRVRQRGYDQAVVIAQRMHAHSGLPYRTTLFRIGQQRQTHSNRTQRTRQLEGAFQLRSKKSEQYEHIILVDDVLTTGATLESAAQTLRSAGVSKVSAVVFARAT